MSPHGDEMIARFVSLLLLGLSSLPAQATTKGLSQIVTPDIQNTGELSLSAQGQNRQIGNPEQIQAELGVLPGIEFAGFQGLDPGEFIFGTEISLIRRDPYLLSIGAINYSTRGGGAQPFLEGGYYTEHDKWILGAISVSGTVQLLAGWAHDFDQHWRVQFDYQGGDQNFSTIGVTFTLNRWVQVNPALYLPNSGDRHGLGYLVASFTLPLWQAPQSEPSGSAGQAL